jgi:hypothetical protein
LRTNGFSSRTTRIPAVRKSGIRGAIRKAGPIGKINGTSPSDGARPPGGLVKRPGLELELRSTKKADVSKMNFP